MHRPAIGPGCGIGDILNLGEARGGNAHVPDYRDVPFVSLFELAQQFREGCIQWHIQKGSLRDSQQRLVGGFPWVQCQVLCVEDTDDVAVSIINRDAAVALGVNLGQQRHVQITIHINHVNAGEGQHHVRKLSVHKIEGSIHHVLLLWV
eukprot:11183_5